MRTRTLFIIVLLGLCATSSLISVGQANINLEGRLFLDARHAAQKGNWAVFDNLKNQLLNYPLYPYLEYYQLSGNFKKANAVVIKQFLNQYPNTPIAYRIRSKLLIELAQDQKWLEYLLIYQPTASTKLQCDYLYALQQTGKIREADALISLLWESDLSQPSDCDIVFADWLKSRADRDNLLWQRFELALKSYNFTLARYLSMRMSERKKNEAIAIILLYAKPDLVNNSVFQKKYPSAEVMSYGIARIGRRDPIGAIKTWERLKDKYTFNQSQKLRVFEAIALRFALRKNNQALIWFQKVVTDTLDPVYEDWLIRAALYHRDWQLVKERVEAMPKEQRDLSQWQYWYARALEQLGDKRTAQQIYTKVATDQSYYGFLAEYRLHKTIEIKNNPPLITSSEIAAVKQLPGFQRAALLYQLKLESDAMLELIYLFHEANEHQQYIIAKLISDWQWYPETLMLTNKLFYKDDFVLRFPLLYKNTVLLNATLRKLNPALIYAVIRQESYFGSGSISPAGAIGLMQLMPTTALRTAKQFQFKYSGIKELLNAEFNIAFGSAHLRKTLGDFAGNAVLTIAAYNAGPDAVHRWLPVGTALPADIWIETIPFHETRHYIKNVISNFIIYQYRLGQVPNLATVMPEINGFSAKQIAHKK